MLFLTGNVLQISSQISLTSSKNSRKLFLSLSCIFNQNHQNSSGIKRTFVVLRLPPNKIQKSNLNILTNISSFVTLPVKKDPQLFLNPNNHTIRKFMNVTSSDKQFTNTISGFTDYKEAEHIAISDWKRTISAVYSQYGFTCFEPRPVEYTKSLCKDGGIPKQIFTVGRLVDGKMTDMALPFDRTVPLALWINRHATDVCFPFKRQDISLSWRGEHAQLGRFRSFYQADVDMIGRNLKLTADSECITAIYRALHAIGINDFRIYLNHMNISKTLVRTLEPAEEQMPELLRIIDKIEKITKDEMIQEIQNLLPHLSRERLERFVAIIAFKGPLTEFPLTEIEHDETAQIAASQLRNLFELLEIQGIPLSILQFCPSMVRGLDYYTGVVFETYLNAIDGGSIASGGRYDKLVESVSDSTLAAAEGLEGVGGSIGLTRLFELVVHHGLVTPTKRTDAHAFICTRNDPDKEAGFTRTASVIANMLRTRNLKIDVAVEDKNKLKKVLSVAEKKGFPFVICVMDDESIVVKNMESKTQEDVKTADEAVASLLRQLGVNY